MNFFNREKELIELQAILSGEPNVVWFIYGPINSGKTALIMQVIEKLPDNYVVFYINFRGFEGGYSKFTRAFFKLGDNKLWSKIKENLPVIGAAVEYVEKVAKKLNLGIELPGEVIKMLQVGEEEPEKIDLFNYLEELMRNFRKKGKIPVLVLDELQVIKDELNATGMPLLARLFNFLVHMTKETHLCHSLCVTSDCLFMEEIHRNARLEGRCGAYLVDDLGKEEAFKVYEKFGFKNKELIWEHIGGKLGDIIRFFEELKRGLSEKEAIKRLLKNEISRLDEMLERVAMGYNKVMFEGKEIVIELEKIKETLKLFKDKEEVLKKEVPGIYRYYLVSKNVLFYDPIEGIVRPQSRLIWRAIKKELEVFG